MSKLEQPFEYTDCKLVKVIDGDTVVLKLEKEFVLEADFGFHIKDVMHLHKTSIQTFRLLGIDTPEVVGADKAAALTATEALKTLLAKGKISVTSHGKDKFGRWLGTIVVNMEDGSSINANEYLLKEGFAKEYIK